MSALLARRRLKNLLLFIPNMLLLCARLLADPRVPKTERALVAGAIIYAIIPFDLIPDMIPFVGQVDDAYLIALTLLRLMERTDPKVVREHWSGGGDVVETRRRRGIARRQILTAANSPRTHRPRGSCTRQA